MNMGVYIYWPTSFVVVPWPRVFASAPYEIEIVFFSLPQTISYPHSFPLPNTHYSSIVGGSYSFGYPNTIAPSEEHHHLLFPTLQIQMPTLHTYSMLVGDAVNDGGFHGGLYDAASIGAVGLA